ncbi:F-box protein At5g67140-like [Curcuma longa]|uniref:F-box protein At5g67140-like n=1 Tax=Curcuma longa TaxID=136217 RepID=UPI003D9FA230
MEAEMESEIERLPVDLLAHIFSLTLSFKDLAQASGVCREWRRGVAQSLARKERLSFAGWNVDDESASRIVRAAYNITELDVSRSCWGCQITDQGLYKISQTKCVGNLLSISLWGVGGITDQGVIQLVSRANSLLHLNIGGTFITDESLYAVANSCPHIKTIVLWSCRHVTEHGLIELVNKCRKLESINVWGMTVPVDCFVSLLAISPALKIKPIAQQLGVGRIWPVA